MHIFKIYDHNVLYVMQEDGPPTTLVLAKTICEQTRLQESEDFSCIELVYSLPGIYTT